MVLDFVSFAQSLTKRGAAQQWQEANILIHNDDDDISSTLKHPARKLAKNCNDTFGNRLIEFNWSSHDTIELCLMQQQWCRRW